MCHASQRPHCVKWHCGRFEFFKGDPAKLRLKLEDFILAALAEDRVQYERDFAFLARERAPGVEAAH